MKLPMIIMPERHWDTLARKALLQALPMLRVLGYDTLRMELPSNLSQAECIDVFERSLEADEALLKNVDALFLPQLAQQGIHVNSLTDFDFDFLEMLCSKTRYEADSSSFNSAIVGTELSWRLAQIPGHRLSLKLLQTMLQLGGSIGGIDLPQNEFHEKLEGDFMFQRKAQIIKANSKREQNFVKQLLELHYYHNGIIFFVGEGHYDGIIKALASEQYLGEVVVIQPHDSKILKSTDKTARQVSLKQRRQQTDYPFLDRALDSEAQIPAFLQQLRATLRQKLADFYHEIPRHRITADLSHATGVTFSAQQRPSFFIDAKHEVAASEDAEQIVENLSEKGIYATVSLFQQPRTICVPEVNSSDVSKAIHRISK